jgi:hypothetical protein
LESRWRKRRALEESRKPLKKAETVKESRKPIWVNQISCKENWILGEENWILGEGNLNIGEGKLKIWQFLRILFPTQLVACLVACVHTDF